MWRLIKAGFWQTQMRQQKREEKIKQALIEDLKRPEMQELVCCQLAVVDGNYNFSSERYTLMPSAVINANRNAIAQSAMNAAIGFHLP
jgi:hypothetical protein